MTAFHVGLRCLLLGATLVTIGRLDEAEQVSNLVTLFTTLILNTVDIKTDLSV